MYTQMYNDFVYRFENSTYCRDNFFKSRHL